MSYFVVCSFDLKDATREDYENAYVDLASLGLKRNLSASQGKAIALPTTMAAGELDGTSAGGVRDDISERVKRAFKARGFSSEIFISVGGNWAWAHRTT